MRKPKQNIILQAIEKIYSSSKNSGLSTSSTLKFKNELRTVSNYLGVTQNEAFFFSLIIAENFCGNSPDMADLCKHKCAEDRSAYGRIKSVNSARSTLFKKCGKKTQ